MNSQLKNLLKTEQSLAEIIKKFNLRYNARQDVAGRKVGFTLRRKSGL